HFEKEPSYEESVYRNLESWMAGLEFNTPEVTEKDQKVFRKPGTAPAALAGKPVKTLRDAKSIKNQRYAIEKESDVTILYFLRDSDASVQFWKRLVDKFGEGSEEKAYCAQELQLRELEDAQGPQDGATFFGYKKRGAALRLAKSLESDVFDSNSLENFPYRIL